MSNSTSTKRVRDLQVGDVIVAMGNVAFDAPHTVTKVDTVGGKFFSAKTDRGGFYPVFMDHAIATVAV